MITKTQIIPLKRVLLPTPFKKESFSKKIAIPTKNEIQILDIDNILYLKADSNYTVIYLLDGAKSMTSATLKKYEEKLNPDQFIRVHNSHIVNGSQISSYLHKDQKVVLSNSQMIPVSRSKKDKLLSYLKTLMV